MHSNIIFFKENINYLLQLILCASMMNVIQNRQGTQALCHTFPFEAEQVHERQQVYSENCIGCSTQQQIYLCPVDKKFHCVILGVSQYICDRPQRYDKIANLKIHN